MIETITEPKVPIIIDDVEVGIEKTKEEALALLRRAGVLCDSQVKELIASDGFKLSRERTRFRLTMETPLEVLGPDEVHTQEAFFEAVGKQGECPHDIILALCRMSMKDELPSELVEVKTGSGIEKRPVRIQAGFVMKPVIGEDGKPYGLVFHNSVSGPMISSYKINPPGSSLSNGAFFYAC